MSAADVMPRPAQEAAAQAVGGVGRPLDDCAFAG
jgi:hypothetical protein